LPQSTLSYITEMTDVEVTEQMREAYDTAFQRALEAVEAEVNQIPGEGQTIALLKSVSNELERWEEGEIDGPLPVAPTVESLREQIKYVVVNKVTWAQTTDYMSKAHKVFDSHLGGGTSMSYKLFALFDKGIKSVRTALRANRYEHALCEAIAVTRAMALNDEWYGDTDAPEQAGNVVKALAGVWKELLGSAGELRDWTSLLSWLTEIRKEWEGQASDHLGFKLVFAFEARPDHPQTPAKRKGGNDVGGVAEEPVSQAKKVKRNAPAQAAQVKASPATQAWLHQLDAQLKERQASLVQLRCAASGSNQKRALVFSGAYPLKAVGFALAEAFGKAVDDFDPHPNKGKKPPGLQFSLLRDGSKQLIAPDLKVVQAVQSSGDVFQVDMEGLSLSITLDAIKFKGSDGFDRVNKRPLPRCVGGDKSLTAGLLKKLNKTFLAGRKPGAFINCSKKEQIEATIKEMALPIALEQGEALVEGAGICGTLGPLGTVPRYSLEPLTLM